MRTTRAFAIFATVGLALSLGASAAVVYPSETTNDWFNVNMAALTTDDLKTAPWTAPVNGEAKVEDRVIKLDTDVGDQLTYTASDVSSNIAVVAATIKATLNAAEPPVTTVPQAALTVVGTLENARWTGLVGGATGEPYYHWVSFTGASVEVGATYSVRIEFDQRPDSRKIRYLVRKQGDGAWTVLGEGDGWYDNPQQISSGKIRSVAFSGTGDVAALDGENIIENTFAFNSLTETEGYDFTNGTLGVAADIQGYTGVRAVLKVSGTGVEKTFDAIDLGTDPVSWDLTDLTQGGVYAYTIEARVGETVVGRQTGTFTAANWPADIWFGADATAGTDNTKNGSWAEGKKPTIENDAYVIDEDALFNVDAAERSKGSNHVTRVDADVTFESLIDTASLEAEDDAFGGFVAARDANGNPQWMALVASSGDNPWAALTGAIVPETNVQYVVRAEVDFLAATKRVRYLVSKNGGEFCPLAREDGSQWINLVVDKGTLEAVELKGAGTMAKFEATIADKAVAKVGDAEYDTLWEALKNGNAATLLTNATLSPDGTITKGSFTVTKGGYGLLVDRAAFGRDWTVEVIDNGTSYTVTIRMAPVGATYQLW